MLKIPKLDPGIIIFPWVDPNSDLDFGPGHYLHLPEVKLFVSAGGGAE